MSARRQLTIQQRPTFRYSEIHNSSKILLLLLLLLFKKYIIITITLSSGVSFLTHNKVQKQIKNLTLP